MRIVTLGWDDLAWAAEVGVARQLQALQEGRVDQFGFDGLNGWGVHIEGACGELAFARATNRAWDASLGRFRGMGGDVDDIQVRTRSAHWHELLIRPGDNPDDLYVLVTGTAPTYVVRGVCRARRVMRPEYLQTHGGRAAAYFIPQHELRAIDRLVLASEEEHGDSQDGNRAS